MTTKAKGADEPTGVTMADAAALNPPTAPDASTPAPEPEAKPFISEGMRHDLEFYGYVTDPLTGKQITKDE